MDEQVDQLLLRVHPTDLPPADVQDVLRLLSREAAVTLPHCGTAEQIFADAWEREQVESTCIGMGLAVPHARVPGIYRTGVYAAFSRSGIPWPNEEAHLITLLIVPLENPEIHLLLLSRIARWRKGLTEAEICALAESPEKLQDSLSEALAL